MAKPPDKPAADQSPAAELLLKFRDTLYTSRTLIIPETGRVLPVARGVVEVSASDEQALSYLKAHAEFEPPKE